MKKSLGSKYFWLSVLLLSAVIFAVGINREKIYQAETRILILPKNVIGAQSMEQAVENAKEIPRSLSFYDKLIKANPGMEESISNLPDQERKIAWNKMLKTKRIGRSGIVSVSAFSADQAQAEDLSTRASGDLQKVMQKYYGAPESIEIKKIDGPIAYLVSDANIINWAFFGLVIGFFTSLIFFSLHDFSYSKVSEKTEDSRKPRFAEKFKRFDFNQRKAARNGVRKAEAPANLPVAEKLTFPVQKANVPNEMGLFPKTGGLEKGELTPEEKRRLHREASPEEVRERLNKLLRGI